VFSFHLIITKEAKWKECGRIGKGSPSREGEVLNKSSKEVPGFSLQKSFLVPPTLLKPFLVSLGMATSATQAEDGQWTGGSYSVRPVWAKENLCSKKVAPPPPPQAALICRPPLVRRPPLGGKRLLVPQQSAAGSSCFLAQIPWP
jgi:hypothetical protein